MNQTAILLLSAYIIPAAVFCIGAPWPQVLAASAIGAVIGLAGLFLRGKRDLPATMKQFWGRGLGTAFLLLQAGAVFALLLRLLPESGRAFPEEQVSPYLQLALAGFCAFACFSGKEAVLRGITAGAILPGVLLVILILAMIPGAAIPAAARAVPQPGLCLLLLPAAAIYLSPPESKRGFLWLLPVLSLPAILSALCAAIPGSDNFYTMAKSVAFSSAFQRIEPLVSLCLTFGWFCLITALALAFGQLLRPLGVPAKVGSAGACLLSALSLAWNIPWNDGILAGCAVVFCVILPLLTLGLVPRKKL